VSPKSPSGRRRRKAGFTKVSTDDDSYNSNASCSTENELRVARNGQVREI
jgi:hypothetical protein